MPTNTPKLAAFLGGLIFFPRYYAEIHVFLLDFVRHNLSYLGNASFRNVGEPSLHKS